MKTELYAHARSLATLLLLLAVPLAAQQVHDGNQKGFPPFGSFHGSNFDVVSLQNGHLQIEIPILSLGQRGETYAYKFVYSTPTWEARWVQDPINPLAGWWVVERTLGEPAGWYFYDPAVKWLLVDYQTIPAFCGEIEYQRYVNFTVQTRDGAKHPLPLKMGKYSSTPGGPPTTCGNEFDVLAGPTLDGTGIIVETASQEPYGRPLSFKVILKDGWQSGRDRNGNISSLGADMLGRNLVTFAYGPVTTCTSPNQQTVNCYAYTDMIVKNSSGNDQVYRIEYVARDVDAEAMCPPSGWPCVAYDPSDNIAVLPSKLILPNGKMYQFMWENNSAEDLLQIDLPTGGYIRYTYATFMRQPPGSEGTNATWSGRRAVASRTIFDGSQERTWNYAIGFDLTTVINPLGNHQVHEYTKIGPVYAGVNRNMAYETKVRSYAGTASPGTLLRTLTKDYAWELSPEEFGAANVRVIRETLQLENGLTSKTETDFDTFPYVVNSPAGCGSNCVATRLNPIERREYAYGQGAPGGLVRKTTFTYLHAGSPAYANLNIVDRVTTAIVRDGSGNIVAQLQNEYDNYTEGILGTSAVNHDTAFGSGYTTRGNVTATMQWRNTDGAWLTTRHQYDDVGNIIKTTDPQGHIATFDYSDAWANTACVPAGQGRVYVKESKNHLNHRVSHTWNSCTGTAASTRDENDILAGRPGTTYSYDLLDRLDITNMPDGGQTDIAYDDTNRIVTTKLKKDSSSFVASRVHYDALGRVFRQDQCEDGPACAQVIRTDTTFDVLGRNETVSNPYRPGVSSPTDGVSKFKYDALGRITRVIPPDGNEAADANVVKTDYNGNITTVTDQAGKQQRSFIDALGRLVEVHEPTGGSPPTPSSGSATISGSLQGGAAGSPGSGSATVDSVNADGSVQVVGGSGATPGAGSATVNGSLQNIPGNSAAAGTGSVTINGEEQSATVQYCSQWGGSPWGCLEWSEFTVWDYGGVSITVNGATKSANYADGSTGASIAAALRDAINADGGFPVSASVTGAVVYLTSKATGAGSNYSLSATSWTNDSTHFASPSFWPTTSGANLTGGQNATPTTYDSGSVWVTVNGAQKSASYGQGSTNTSVATALRDAINADGGYPVSASLSGATVTLTAKATGTATNYSFSGGSSTSQPGSFSQPSFTVAVSGSALTGGSNGTAPTYDSGSVWLTVNGSTKSVSYGQGSTKTAVATALRDAINGDTGYAVSAALSVTTLTLTAKSNGTNTNYSLSGGSSTVMPGTFSQPSFSIALSGSALTGGANPIPVDSGSVWITANGQSKSVSYASGSTESTVASALASAINADGAYPVSASLNGTTLTLTSKATGAAANSTLSGGSSTNYPETFSSASFNANTSGMNGGSDGSPGSLATPAVTRYIYNALDNLVCTWQKGTDTSAEPPDPANNCLNAPPAWRPRKFSYNSLSELLTATNPESGTVSYTYDNDGNLVTKTDARGITTCFGDWTPPNCNGSTGYDPLHRLLKRSYSDGSPIQTLTYDIVTDGGGWQFNMVGRLSRSCWAGSYENCDFFGYDSMGRITRHEQGGGLWGLIDSQYNLVGLRTELRYWEYYTGKDRKVANDYDSAGRVRKVYETTGALKVYADNITYHAHGAWSSMTLSNGAMQQTASYNSRLQPTSKTVTKVSPASTVMNFTYTFTDAQGRNNGNVISMWDNVQVLNYGFQYDELNRLTRAETTNSNLWGNTYAYDMWGNLYQKNQIVGMQHGEFFQQTMNTRNQFNGWSYDAAGNLLNDGAHNYQYDPEGRIKCLEAGANCASPAASYVYTVEGRRVKRTTNGVTTLYQHDGGSVLSEFTNPGQGVGAWQKDYIYLNAALLATESAADSTRYHFGDHLGTPRVVTDASGNVINRHDYYPYGKEITPWSDGETHKFSGKERDAESGLDYFIARYYSSAQGRFVSPDPENAGAREDDPQSWNAYPYARNNPLLYVDPLGLDYWVSIYGGTSFSVGTWEELNTLALQSGVCLGSRQASAAGCFLGGVGDRDSGTIRLCTYWDCEIIGSYFWYFGPVARKQALQAAGEQAEEEVKRHALTMAVDGATAGVGAALGWFARLLGPKLIQLGLRLIPRGAAPAIGRLSDKILRQMKTRGWTADEIMEAYAEGRRVATTNNATGGPATRYVHPRTGKSVVIDDTTGEVIQVGAAGHKQPGDLPPLP